MNTINAIVSYVKPSAQPLEGLAADTWVPAKYLYNSMFGAGEIPLIIVLEEEHSIELSKVGVQNLLLCTKEFEEDFEGENPEPAVARMKKKSVEFLNEVEQDLKLKVSERGVIIVLGEDWNERITSYGRIKLDPKMHGILQYLSTMQEEAKDFDAKPWSSFIEAATKNWDKRVKSVMGAPGLREALLEGRNAFLERVADKEKSTMGVNITTKNLAEAAIDKAKTGA